MKADITKYLARVLMVIAELRATIVVVPGMNGVNALQPCLVSKQLSKLVGYAIDTTNSRNNPYFVTYAHFSVRSFVAEECTVGKRYLQLLVNG